MPEKPVLTYTIMLICAIVYILQTQAGGSNNTQTALHFGAFYVPLVRERKQYWRFVAAAFVHFGLGHIVMNMYSLYNLGPQLERIAGPARFLEIYLGSAICGNLMTWIVESRRGSWRVSAGASGAIFGLFGVYLAMAVLPGGLGGYTLPVESILITIAVNLIGGILLRRQINNAAHIGGLIGGFLLAIALF